MALEEKLLEIANRVNEKINKDEQDKAVCSIFLKDIHYGNRYILRASTKGDFYLGTASIVITENDIRKYNEGLLQNIGLTKYAILEKKGVFTDSVTTDKRWSLYGWKEDNIVKREKEHFCEFSYKELGNFIAVPILSPKTNEVIGIIRVVNNKDSRIKYSEKELEKIKEIINEESFVIDSMSAYSSLIEIGAFLDLKELCKQATIIINNLLGGKGCSVFLLDEEKSGPYKKIYRCFASTDLAYKDKDGEVKKIEEPYNDERATYVYEPKKIEGIARPEIPLTLGVIRARQNAFIDDLDNQEDIDKQFTGEYKISRVPGTGRSCEYYLENGEYIGTKSVLLTTLFYRERYNRNTDVLGVLRIARPTRSRLFTLEEKHLFIWMAEELSLAIINAKYVELLNSLVESKDIESLFLKIVEGIPKFIGGKECAILIKNGDGLKKQAEWKSGVARFYRDYDVEKDEYNPSSGFCFDVPLLKKDSREDFGVIRICKGLDETLFTENDKTILSQLTKRLMSEIERLERIKEMNLLIRQAFHEISPLLFPIYCYIQNDKKGDALRVAEKIRSAVDDLGNYRLGITELIYSPCQISGLIEETIKDYEQKINEKGIECKIVKPTEEGEISIDKIKMGIVFRNLISNAVEAISNGQGKIEIVIYKNNGMYNIIFKDNGCGMKDSVKERLLKEFVSSKQEGLGIGLYLSNRIIKAHQGTLSFESEYGKSSVFTINLPEQIGMRNYA